MGRIIEFPRSPEAWETLERIIRTSAEGNVSPEGLSAALAATRQHFDEVNVLATLQIELPDWIPPVFHDRFLEVAQKLTDDVGREYKNRIITLLATIAGLEIRLQQAYGGMR